MLRRWGPRPSGLNRPAGPASGVLAGIRACGGTDLCPEAVVAARMKLKVLDRCTRGVYNARPRRQADHDEGGWSGNIDRDGGRNDGPTSM